MLKLKLVFLKRFHPCIHFAIFHICHPTMVPYQSLSMLNRGAGGVKDYDYGTTRINNMIL